MDFGQNNLAGISSNFYTLGGILFTFGQNNSTGCIKTTFGASGWMFWGSFFGRERMIFQQFLHCEQKFSEFCQKFTAWCPKRHTTCPEKHFEREELEKNDGSLIISYFEQKNSTLDEKFLAGGVKNCILRVQWTVLGKWKLLKKDNFLAIFVPWANNFRHLGEKF